MSETVTMPLESHQKLVRERDQAIELLIRLGHPEAAQHVCSGKPPRMNEAQLCPSSTTVRIDEQETFNCALDAGHAGAHEGGGATWNDHLTKPDPCTTEAGTSEVSSMLLALSNEIEAKNHPLGPKSVLGRLVGRAREMAAQRTDKARIDTDLAEEWERQYQWAIRKLRTTLDTIRTWDMLNPQPGGPEFLADGPWLRDLIETALEQTTPHYPADPRAETAVPRTMKCGLCPHGTGHEVRRWHCDVCCESWSSDDQGDIPYRGNAPSVTGSADR